VLSSLLILYSYLLLLDSYLPRWLAVVSDVCALISKYTAGFKIIIEPFDERLPNVLYSHFILYFTRTLLVLCSCCTRAVLVLYAYVSCTFLMFYSCFTHTLSYLTHPLLILTHTFLILFSYFTHTLLGARPDPACGMPRRLACDEGRL
jgi:hypothetical protein